MKESQLTNYEEIKKFMLGGDAFFTLLSKKTGERKTFHVQKAPLKKQGELFNRIEGYFVSMLTGSNNQADYRYLGFVWEFRGVLNFKWNKQGWAPESLRAFDWFLCRINDHGVGLDRVEFWHMGRCCRCGLPLTTPESIKRGIGPVCEGR